MLFRSLEDVDNKEAITQVRFVAVGMLVEAKFQALVQPEAEEEFQQEAKAIQLLRSPQATILRQILLQMRLQILQAEVVTIILLDPRYNVTAVDLWATLRPIAK